MRRSWPQDEAHVGTQPLLCHLRGSALPLGSHVPPLLHASHLLPLFLVISFSCPLEEGKKKKKKTQGVGASWTFKGQVERGPGFGKRYERLWWRRSQKPAVNLGRRVVSPAIRPGRWRGPGLLSSPRTIWDTLLCANRAGCRLFVHRNLQTVISVRCDGWWFLLGGQEISHGKGRGRNRTMWT